MASLLIYITVVLSNIITSETVATPAIAGIEEAPTAGAAIIKVKIHHAVYYSSLRFKRCRVSEVVLNWLSPVYSTTNTTAQCRQYTWGGGTGGGCECVQKSPAIVEAVPVRCCDRRPIRWKAYQQLTQVITVHHSGLRAFYSLPLSLSLARSLMGRCFLKFWRQ